MPAFRVKLGANDLNCVDMPLNPTHSPRLLFMFCFLPTFPSFTVSQLATYGAA